MNFDKRVKDCGLKNSDIQESHFLSTNTERTKSHDGKVLNDSNAGRRNVIQLSHNFPESCLIIGSKKKSDRIKPLGSGVVLGEKLILTAAHVVQDKEGISVSFEGDFKSVTKDNRVPIKNVKVHKNYWSTETHFDLAILEFEDKLPVQSRSLGSQMKFPEKQALAVVGYGGLTSRGSSAEFIKNYTSDIHLISNSGIHGKNMEVKYGYSSDIEFVVSAKPCEYDSGGAVFFGISSNREVVGIVARKVDWGLYTKPKPYSCLRDTICTRLDNFNLKDYV